MFWVFPDIIQAVGLEQFWKTDLGQDELLHWFVPHSIHPGPWTDGTEASCDHRLLQKPQPFIHLVIHSDHITTDLKTSDFRLMSVDAGGGAVTSWSSWRSFTVTLLWNWGQVPLGNTPILVMTTGWRTLKSSAMTDMSERESTEGSDTVTISISSSRPVAGTEHGGDYWTSTGRNYYSTNNDGRVVQGDKKMTLVKIHHQHFGFEDCLFKESFCSRVRFLNYKGHFITREINGKIRPVKQKTPFYFTSLLRKFCWYEKQLEMKKCRQRESSC